MKLGEYTKNSIRRLSKFYNNGLITRMYVFVIAYRDLGMVSVSASNNNSYIIDGSYCFCLVFHSYQAA